MTARGLFLNVHCAAIARANGATRSRRTDPDIDALRIMVMEAPIAEVKKRLCELVSRVEAGETVIILRHGRPTARLMPLAGRGRPWRVEEADDRAAYRGIDLDETILEVI